MRMLKLLSVVALALSGCVMVNPSNVSVTGIGGQSSGSKAPATPRTAYADALEKVIKQQEKVAHELGKRDWEELDEEANDWVEYTRTLIGYADTSHDPQLFRQYGDELLAATREVQRAAGQRDPSRCHKALVACDPLLDRFARDFPLTPPPKGSKPRPAAKPQPKPAKRPIVP